MRFNHDFTEDEDDDMKPVDTREFAQKTGELTMLMPAISDRGKPSSTMRRTLRTMAG